MGDVGSLALGGALGTVALLIKQELLLPIVGGLFVLEGLSVILQVASFKLTGKRIFRMAPLHHHFELIGWSEPKVCALHHHRDRLRGTSWPLEAARTTPPQRVGTRVVVGRGGRSGVARPRW